jgi:hypothetical protein
MSGNISLFHYMPSWYGQGQFCFYHYYISGHLGSSVGIATDYGLDGPEIESRWGRDFPPVQNGPGAHPASCKMGTSSFSGVEAVGADPQPHLMPRS